MFGTRNVELQFTDRARRYIERARATAGLAAPILSIKWAKWHDEPAERWVIGFNDRSRVHEGWIGISPELEFVVIQEWVLDALNGKTLDIDEQGVVIT